MTATAAVPAAITAAIATTGTTTAASATGASAAFGRNGKVVLPVQRGQQGKPFHIEAVFLAFSISRSFAVILLIAASIDDTSLVSAEPSPGPRDTRPLTHFHFYFAS